MYLGREPEPTLYISKENAHVKNIQVIIIIVHFNQFYLFWIGIGIKVILFLFKARVSGGNALRAHIRIGGHFKERLYIAINRADFVSSCMLYIYVR